MSAYLEPRIAPRAIFDALEERSTRVRYMVREGDDYRAVTWGAHAREIRQIGLFLLEELKTGDTAAIFAPNRVEWMSAAMAIQSVGGVMVPIYPSSTADQASYVLNHADAKVLFVDTEPLLARILQAWPELRSLRRIVLFDATIDVAKVLSQVDGGPSFADVERKIVPWDKALALGAARDREEPHAFDQALGSVSLTQPGLMLYTSGTSGRPKGVPLTHQNVAANGADWLQVNAPLVEEGAVDLLWLPMSHIFGFGEACLGNSLGWTSYMSDPARVVDDLPKVQPQVFMSVPSLWEKLARSALKEEEREAQNAALHKATGGNLKFCLSGGAGLKREIKELYHGAGVLLIEGYGLTECSPTLTLNRPDAFRFDSVGKPLPSVELRLAEDGEILAKGPNVFSGYHKDPAASADAFSDGWFKTGDIGRWTEDGFLQIVDRKKDILVTAGGKNVAPANIEIRFVDDPFITHLVVYGDSRKYLVAAVWTDRAAVEAKLGADANAEAIRSLVGRRIDRANAELARFETIRKFTVVDTPLTVEGGLLTPTLKVKRKAVYQRFSDVFEELYR
ncbi:MAG: AMP-dependent synthetase/ligase [Myxococcota bacterium]